MEIFVLFQRSLFNNFTIVDLKVGSLKWSVAEFLNVPHLSTCTETEDTD